MYAGAKGQISISLHQPRIELGAHELSTACGWESWILPLNHWCCAIHLIGQKLIYIMIPSTPHRAFCGHVWPEVILSQPWVALSALWQHGLVAAATKWFFRYEMNNASLDHSTSGIIMFSRHTQCDAIIRQCQYSSSSCRIFPAWR